MDIALPVILFNVLTAVLHGGLIVGLFAVLKQVRSWPLVFVVAFGFALLSVAMSFATVLLQGWERASQMLLPGGEMFAAVALPMIINAVISAIIIATAAYALFVEPGTRKNV